MDTSQSLLFDSFPRTIGVTTPHHDNGELSQYVIHSRSEFDGVVESSNGRRNLYCSISQFQPGRKEERYAGNAISVDKVAFDFDSSAKADPNSEYEWLHPLLPKKAADIEIWKKMKDSVDIRDSVLGDVCDDVRRLAEACIEASTPLIGVFSGFGVHCHMLFQETKRRARLKMESTYRKWISNHTLSTADEKASGKPFRILRIPNVERVDESNGKIKPLGMYTVPLRHDELLDITPQRLMDLSRSPRVSVGVEPGDRPELKVEQDHVGPTKTTVGQEKMRPIPTEGTGKEFAKHLVKEVVGMPCVYERAIGRNPPNDVRVKLGIMFLNAGFSPREITDIVRKLNWVDFDAKVTKYQLQKLQESGRGDWSCKTMRGKGLCTRADEPHECSMFGYIGGNSPQ